MKSEREALDFSQQILIAAQLGDASQPIVDSVPAHARSLADRYDGSLPWTSRKNASSVALSGRPFNRSSSSREMPPTF